MDRERRAEIIRNLAMLLAIMFCIAAGWSAFARQEEELRQEQIVRLIQMHPELEADLIRVLEKDGREAADTEPQERENIRKRLEEIYGYSGGDGALRHRIRRFCGYSMLVILLFFLFFVWNPRRRKRIYGQYAANLKQIGNALKEMERGETGTDREEKGLENRNERKADFRKTQEEIELAECLREHAHYLADLKERYEQEEEETKALITDISHQLKTPLASLRMSHELLESTYLTAEEQKEFLHQEQAEIARLQKLLEEMIRLSRLEKHMIDLKPELCSLRNTISEAVSAVYPKAAAKSMEIQVEMEGDWNLPHDAHWTAEAFTNILDNAVKYAPPHTRIQIRAERLVRNVLITFADEGPGIPEKEKHRIYQRFYRGANSEGIEGTGVGLYLSRKILEDQKGSIRVKNRPVQGSAFQVMLPL